MSERERLIALCNDHAHYMETYNAPFVGSTDAIARCLREAASYLERQPEREAVLEEAVWAFRHDNVYTGIEAQEIVRALKAAPAATEPAAQDAGTASVGLDTPRVTDARTPPAAAAPNAAGGNGGQDLLTTLPSSPADERCRPAAPSQDMPSVTPEEWQRLVELAREEGRIAGRNEALANRLSPSQDMVLVSREAWNAALSIIAQTDPQCAANLLAAHQQAGAPVTQGAGALKLDTDRKVFFYEQDHYYLSNFSAFKVHWKGRIFDTVEHAYHWTRFPEESPERTIVIESASAHDAFRFAQANKAHQRFDWDTIKVQIMEQILRAKAKQHEYVRRKLLQTGDRELIENSWRDAFWGWGENRDGLNMLGKLWMQVRDELSAAPQVEQAGAEGEGSKNG